MTAKPILFTGGMVRAILDGRKTQTRRVVKPPKGHELLEHLGEWPDEKTGLDYHRFSMNKSFEFSLFPVFQPGDILWVRETLVNRQESGRFETANTGQTINGIQYGCDSYTEDHWKYAADEEYLEDIYDAAWKPKRLSVPSIHMPKWACRLFLKVTDVRCERVQSITGQDCENEGVQEYMGGFCAKRPDGSVITAKTARSVFRELWNSINAKRGYGWDVNPWVWVYSFEQTEKPEGWPEVVG